MKAMQPRRRHSDEFKRKVCTEIRSGALGRREAQRTYRLSDNLIQAWLARFNAPVPGSAAKSRAVAAATDPHEACQQQVAALKQKVRQLARALRDRSTSSPRD